MDLLMFTVYMDWLFIFVLPVALHNDPCSKHAAISCNVLTATSVDPARVITPFDASRICIGDFPGTATFPACPLATTDLLSDAESSKSLTSSLKIFKLETQ
jgi:hypothetical protein